MWRFNADVTAWWDDSYGKVTIRCTTSHNKGHCWWGYSTETTSTVTMLIRMVAAPTRTAMALHNAVVALCNTLVALCNAGTRGLHIALTWVHQLRPHLVKPFVLTIVIDSWSPEYFLATCSWLVTINGKALANLQLKLADSFSGRSSRSPRFIDQLLQYYQTHWKPMFNSIG